MPDRFNYIKRGYDPAEVDEYIESLENVVKSYKEKDMAIKNALINAELAAGDIIKKAEIEAGRAKGKAVAQLERIFTSVSRQRSLFDRFKQDYQRLAQTYLKEVDERDFAPVLEEITKLEDYIESLKNLSHNDGDTG